MSALIVALGAGIFFIIQAVTGQPGTSESLSESVVLLPPEATVIQPVETPSAEPEESPTPTPAPSLSADIVLSAVAGKTDAQTLGVETDIMKSGKKTESFAREQPVSFGSGDEYTALEGVITFRGNNYRNAPSWGTATIKEGKLELINTKETANIGKWRGMGWTGQPLVVKWPSELRARMTSLYESFRNKDNFVEVIICALDGYIYFEELETGEKTRTPIKIGAPTKGTASLDPRGYPILYVGQGLQKDGNDKKSANMYFRAYSLIDGKKLMEWGAANKDPFAYRSWQAYDSSALIDADTDTLIMPGENGVLYTMEMHTKYNAETGEVSMDYDPEKVKYRYTTDKNKDTKTWGTENSAVAWRNYIIYSDNTGLLQCVDLNTMQLVYATDLGNDSDVSMVLEEDTANQTFYLYTAYEYDDAIGGTPGKGTVYAKKINGLTGETIWSSDAYTVQSPDEGVDGGILASPVLGKEGTSMAGLIVYNISQEVKGDKTTSRLAALDKLTGKEVWSYDMDAEGWSPSSPVPVYTDDGQGYIVQCDINGDIALIKVNGQSYEEAYVLNVKDEEHEIWNKFEATPVVFGNYIVVGSKSGNIFFIKII